MIQCPNHCCLHIFDYFNPYDLPQVKRFVLAGRIQSGHPSKAEIPKPLMVCYLLSPDFPVLVFELLGAEISPMPGKHFSFSHKQIPGL